MPSSVPLAGILDSMQKLGKSTDAILNEFRTAMECNEALFGADAVQTLLESVKKDGQNEDLSSGLAKSRGKAEFTPPPELMTRLLALAGRQHRLLELSPRLMQFQLQLEPRVLNELLQEANRRRDAVFCREVYRFAVEANAPKNT